MFKKLKQLFSKDQKNEYETTYEFIWGIESIDNLTDRAASCDTMNDIDILYDKESKTYSLGIETIYGFGNEREKEKKYITKLFNELTKWMSSKGYNITKELDIYDVFTAGLNINSEFESLEQLYATFKFMVKGFCNE